MVTPHFHPHIGGVEKFVQRISEELAGMGHAVEVLTDLHDPALPSEEKVQALTVTRIPRRSLLRLWQRVWGLRRYASSFDVIHCHNSHTVFWVLPWVVLLGRRRFFLSLIGDEGMPVRSKVVVLRRISQRLTVRTLCLSRYLERWYGVHCHLDCHGGVDVPPSLPGPGQKDRAVFVGRLERDTDIMLFLQAAALIRANGIPLKMDVCGDGPLQEEAKARAEDVGGIAFHGRVPSVEPFLDSAQYAFASRYLSILEAMARGRAVLAICGDPLRRAYLEDFPGAHTVFSLCSSPEEFAAEFQRLRSDDDELRSRILAGQELARTSSWRGIAELYLRLYANGDLGGRSGLRAQTLRSG